MRRKTPAPVARQPLEVVRDKLAAITDWTAENVHHAIQSTADELEVGMGKVGMPLRVAVTGAGQSPDWMSRLRRLVSLVALRVLKKRWPLLPRVKLSNRLQH